MYKKRRKETILIHKPKAGCKKMHLAQKIRNLLELK